MSAPPDVVTDADRAHAERMVREIEEASADVRRHREAFLLFERMLRTLKENAPDSPGTKKVFEQHELLRATLESLNTKLNEMVEDAIKASEEWPALLTNESNQALDRLKGRREPANVFSEHMTSATLRERNRAISRAKSHTALSEACRAAGLQSKNELAKKLKMSPGSLVAYEQGRLVPAAVRAKIKSLTVSKLHPAGFDAWPNPEK